MYLDTRDLVETREDLKQEVLDSFLETFEHYAEQTDEFEDILFEEQEIQDWKNEWGEELNQIDEIDEVEDDINSYSGNSFEDGVTLIEETDFEEYCEDFCRDVVYVDSNLPALIENNIDWSGVADDMRIDYTGIEYQGTTYLYR